MTYSSVDNALFIMSSVKNAAVMKYYQTFLRAPFVSKVVCFFFLLSLTVKQ